MFSHFAKIYSSSPDTDLLADEDQLLVARKVMLELYKLAGRRVPDFFSHIHCRKIRAGPALVEVALQWDL